MLVDGTYDDAFDLTVKAAQEFGWYCRNTGYNPFTAEGKKTAAFESGSTCRRPSNCALHGLCLSGRRQHHLRHP